MVSFGEREELILLLLLERLGETNKDFNEFIKENYNVSDINTRYINLLDKFLQPYALNKTEKSD